MTKKQFENYYRIYTENKRKPLTLEQIYKKPSKVKQSIYSECLLRTPFQSIGTILTYNIHMFTYGYEYNNEFIIVTKNGVNYISLEEL